MNRIDKRVVRNGVNDVFDGRNVRWNVGKKEKVNGFDGIIKGNVYQTGVDDNSITHGDLMITHLSRYENDKKVVGKVGKVEEKLVGKVGKVGEKLVGKVGDKLVVFEEVIGKNGRKGVKVNAIGLNGELGLPDFELGLPDLGRFDKFGREIDKTRNYMCIKCYKNRNYEELKWINQKAFCLKPCFEEFKNEQTTKKLAEVILELKSEFINERVIGYLEGKESLEVLNRDIKFAVYEDGIDFNPVKMINVSKAAKLFNPKDPELIHERLGKVKVSDIIEAQMKDKKLQVVYEYIETEDVRILKQMDKFHKKYVKDYVIINGLLYYCKNTINGNPRILLGESIIESVLKYYHNSVYNGHDGIGKYKIEINSRFWFDN